MSTSYRQVSGWRALSGDTTLLATPEGGRLAVDARLLELWRRAEGKTLDEIRREWDAAGEDPEVVRAAVACLAEAGALERGETRTTTTPASARGPSVAAVVVAHRGRQWLSALIPSLLAQSFSPLEVIIVDSGSDDGTAGWVREGFPSIHVIELPTGSPYSRAVNIGIAAGASEWVLVLNQDLVLDPDAVAQLVDVARADPACAAVACKLRFLWARSFLNGIGNRVGDRGWGTDNAIGHLDLGQFDGWTEVPSACFAAALLSREAWLRVGPLDERLPMYYEDAEWSYRARLAGWRIRAAPRAVAYHAMGGRAPSGQPEQLPPEKLRCVAYGRLHFALKLLRGRLLLRFLRNYLREDRHTRSTARLQGDRESAAAVTSAWRAALAACAELRRENRRTRRRTVLDQQHLFVGQENMPAALLRNGLPELTWSSVEHHYLPLMRSGRVRRMPELDDQERRIRLLIVSNDVVDRKMAGPGLRYLEMALALRNSVSVLLAVPAETSLEDVDGVHLVRYDEEVPQSLEVLVDNADVALISGYMATKFPFLAETGTRLVVDLYDPFVFENLHYHDDQPPEARHAIHRAAVDVMNRLAYLGDYFVCGSERQRDLWLGVLLANHRVTPAEFRRDPSLNSLIDVVGTGVPDRSPVSGPLLRGRHPCVPQDARIVLWGGGVWDWLDPLTLIRAWPGVLAQRPEARLVFLGTRHPNPQVPAHAMARRARDLAERIGELDRTVLFFEWLDTVDREALLSEASAGVVLHPLHVETRYSLRTRVMDCIWAAIPVVITEGDVTSEWVARHGIGRVVPQHDDQAVAEALLAVMETPRDAWLERFGSLRETLRWSRVVEPLERYCRTGARTSPRRPPAAERLSRRILRVLYEEGARGLLRKSRRAIAVRLGIR